MLILYGLKKQILIYINEAKSQTCVTSAIYIWRTAGSISTIFDLLDLFPSRVAEEVLKHLKI